MKAIGCAPTAFMPTTRTRLQSGFTLLELLTAMAILAIVVSLVFGSFDAVFSTADAVNTGSDLIEMGNACLDRIRTDLEAIHVSLYPRYKPPDMDAVPELYRVVGSEKSVGGDYYGQLRFTSLAHLAFNQDEREGIAEIVYYVQESENDGNVLRRADKLYPYPEEFEENPMDPAMCEQVREFELTYYDAEGRDYKEWNSESDDFEYGSPRFIGIKLVVGDETTSFELNTQVVLPVFRFQPVKK